MSPETYKKGQEDFSAPLAETPEPLSSPEEDVVLPTVPETLDKLQSPEQPEETGESLVLRSISSAVSKKDLSRYAQLLAAKIETIPNEDSVLLLVNLMKRFVVEEANEKSIEGGGKNRGRTRLSVEFEEFQSSQDIQKQTLRFMVEMLVDEWVRATGRHLIDQESSQQVNEAIRAIRGDMKAGWFKRIFRGKLTETEIIKSMEVLQLELDGMREKLKKAKMQEAEIANNSASIIKTTKEKSQEIEDGAKTEAKQLTNEAKKEARSIIEQARQEAEKKQFAAEEKVKKAEEKLDSAKLEEERLRTIIAELKSNPDVAKVYEAKYNKEESFHKFRRDILLLKADKGKTRVYYNKRLQDILDSFAILTTEDKSGMFLDIWVENGGTMKKLPSKNDTNFWEALKLFLPPDETKEKSILTYEDFVSPERAVEIMASDFLGAEAVEAVFDIKLDAKEIPAIPFSEADLERAKELGQFLVLRTDKDPDGEPLTMEKMNELLAGKFKKAKKGKILYNTDWYKNEEFFTAETPQLGWALVSKENIPDSTSKNYLEQTQELVKYITNEIFKEKDIPPDYQEAIAEFEDYYDKNFKGKSDDEIKQLIGGDKWPKYVQELGDLKINQLTRQTPAEALYDMLMHFQKNDRILEKKYTWTNRRSSDGGLVSVGWFDADGAYVSSWGFGDSRGNLGVSFSRSF